MGELAALASAFSRWTRPRILGTVRSGRDRTWRLCRASETGYGVEARRHVRVH